MKIRFKNMVALVSALVFAALFSGCGGFDENQSGQAEKPGETAETRVEAGYMAPDFEVELLGGGKAKLSDCRGKAVLINFWATWCGPCVGEMPDIQRLSERFEGELAVIAVNCGERKDKVEAFVAQNGYTFAIGLDGAGAVQKKYPTNGIPYTIILDPAGTITAIHLGAGGDMFSVYEKDIAAALGK